MAAAQQHGLRNEQEKAMDQIDENAWIERRETEIEAMWNTPLPETEVEITEDDLPF